MEKDFCKKENKISFKRNEKLCVTKGKYNLKTNVKISYKDDMILFEQLAKIILMAIEISDKSEDESIRIQNLYFDKH